MTKNERGIYIYIYIYLLLCYRVQSIYKSTVYLESASVERYITIICMSE